MKPNLKPNLKPAPRVTSRRQMNREALAQRQQEMRERREDERMGAEVLIQGQTEILQRLDVLAREQKETREMARAASQRAHRTADSTKETQVNRYTTRAIPASAWTAKQ